MDDFVFTLFDISYFIVEQYTNSLGSLSEIICILSVLNS